VQLPEITRRQAFVVVALALVALALGGRLLTAHGGARESSSARLRPIASRVSSRIYIHVAGAVRRPGLYRLPAGTRVNDALAKAGGAKPSADLTLVNLAAPLADGQQVLVPARAPLATALATGSSASSSATSGPLHLNSATLEQLDTLPGVGPTTAQRIIDYRSEHGPFASVDELDAVSGIGPARLEELRDLVVP